MSSSADPVDGFLDRTVRLIGTEPLLSLRNKRIVIAGCGGVGGAASIALARLGVRRFTLADPGIFDPPDMNRQWGALGTTMGRNKAEVYEELVRSIQPKVEVRVFREGITEGNVSAFLEGGDLLIDSLDLSVPRSLRMKVYELADEGGIPGISAPIIGLGTLVAASTAGGMPLTVWGDFVAGVTGGGSIELPAKLYELFSISHVEALIAALAHQMAPSNSIATTLATAITCSEALMILGGPSMPGWRPHVSLPQVIAVDLSRMTLSVFDFSELRRRRVRSSAPAEISPFTAEARRQRESLLERVGYNPNLLPSGAAAIDVSTDSFAERLASPTAPSTSPMAHLRPEEYVKALYGYESFVLVSKGRFAEALLAKAMIKPGRPVAATPLFPTTAFHVTTSGAPLVPVGVSEGLATVRQPFGGNVDLGLLEKVLAAESPQAIYIELCNNALGGAPASLENLRGVHRLASEGGIPVILDAARAFENAVLVREREPGQQGRTLVSIVRDLCACSDACATSLSKDFPVPAGAFVASRIPEVAVMLLDLAILGFGDGLTTLTRGALAEGMSTWHEGEGGAADRVQSVQMLWRTLREAGVPVGEQPGGHAVCVDARRFLPLVGMDAHPALTLCAALYAVAGVRASVHFASAHDVAAGGSSSASWSRWGPSAMHF